MEDKLISICIPTYNGEKYLQESLDSIKQQTYKNIEVIISDDQSKDRTLEICEQFKREVNFPVHIHSHIPSGIGANWNNSIEKSNGFYVKILFQDDVMVPECLESMVQHLINHKLEIVVSKRKIIDQNSNEITEGSWYENFNDLQKPAGMEINKFVILKRKNLRTLNFERYSIDNIIGEPCVSLFTRKLYSRVGPFNIKSKQILDYEYWLRVLAFYDIGIIPEKLMKFRHHDEQASNVNTQSKLYEGDIILNLLYTKHILYIDRKKAKYYLVKKYPLLRKLILLRYKIFP
ncbi:glycosyltransferase [Chryseobacterium sp. Leaf394]|uniref:glycosyltransferase family 2 protein n=1 Tax=Chryseobacterium sp. Leaf394 TaxID=1736361 RepID=UPI000700E860|nr:glycosyltransferase [Chryseobacterium sp. Leaf394]KQS95216.1 hypothetical protein ASG21_17400 [Chryseobacterium sp. Leaf394]